MKAILKAWDKRPENDHGKFSVLAFWSSEDGSLITDTEIIKDIFKDDGNIFEPSFYINYSGYMSHRYIMVETTENLHEKATDKYKIKDVMRAVEYTVIESEGFLVGDDIVDLSVLDDVETPLKNFYIKFYNKYWGPFKRDNNNNVVAVNGGKVSVYEHVPILQDNEIKLVYEKPKTPIRTIPAYTISQISKLFRSVIKDLGHPVSDAILSNKKWYQDLNESISMDEQLTSSQLQLAMRNLSGIEITFDELKILLQHSDSQPLLTAKIDSLRNEVKDELEQEIRSKIFEESEELIALKAKKGELENNISKHTSTIKKQKIQLDSQLSKLDTSVSDKKSELQLLKKELAYIEENKDRLIADMKVSQKLYQPTAITLPINHYTDYDIINSVFYESPKDIITTVLKIVKERKINIPEDWQFKESMSKMVNRKGILSNSINLIISYLRAIGSCKIRHVNVQANWISHSQFASCNIDSFISEANQDPDHLYYLILQDFNIASPECYLRPFIDFMQSLVPSYKSYDGSWPINFHVIGIVLPTPEVGIQVTASILKTFDSIREIQSSDGSYGSWSTSDLRISEEILLKLKEINTEYNTSEYAS